MEAFVKSFSTYRTIKKASVLQTYLVMDSLDEASSSVTVAGTAIGRSDAGNWLIIDGAVYWISDVKPDKNRTVLTLASPLDAFSRPLEYQEPAAGQTVGGFIQEALTANWVNCEDAAYCVPYLSVSHSDTTAQVVPELDNAGCFELPDYCRLMRKSYRVTLRFTNGGDKLICMIFKATTAFHQVSFEDGRSQLQNVDYSQLGTAKITVLCDVDSGETDENGEAILVRQRTDWYLAEDSSVSQEVPARRAPGKWTTITVKAAADIEAKVIEEFAKNKANHKLEFWSTLDLNVQDTCTFLVYGELLQSYISYRRKGSDDKRFYYKSGELATTATEKLKGALK